MSLICGRKKDLTGAIEVWIDVGQPDDKRVRRACGRAVQVFIYAYGDRVVDSWWGRAREGLEHVSNLRVLKLSSSTSQAAARLAARTMRLDCTIQDGRIWLADATQTVEIGLAPMNTR